MNRLILFLLLAGSAAILNAADCLECHANVTLSADGAHHDAGEAGCQQCHGSGEEHVTNPAGETILAFDTEPVAERNAACETCHADGHASGMSVHASAGVACSDCHAMHADAAPTSSLLPGFNRLDRTSAVCADCHEDVLAQFAFNERHRLAENALTCIDCHDPHQSRRAPVLQGAVDNGCADCHPDTTGPFLFEHAASRVDGCVACHAPHGSANRHLLTHQSVGEQCYSCHAAVPQFHLGFAPGGSPRFGLDSVCTNCHVTIHGSNLDRLFLK